ncbi:predicted protein [Sclerotinia sclerotiorum 1980 UF-70]|uniref:Uncharacterized protein n=1 Tax=Sclerotinia sclerotiorum (strain ATCC 18683 / 1980 / Ss-1) TaxID=665079 RepID=A7F0H2_SCLS1|nr:predicted protein [Sclerotinia sclerotiorum 1980 UF-70]EDN95214.1 predicted protein [Sclerotinia sclerotiorum 1980 UF-70]
MLCFLEAGGGRNSCRNSVIDGTELSTGFMLADPALTLAPILVGCDEAFLCIPLFRQLAACLKIFAAY